MIYLDHGATSMGKPIGVERAMVRALRYCGNPGRSGHGPAMEAAKTVYDCREQAAMLFDCQPEQVTFTGSCTHGLNIAINTLVKPGGKVVVSGFEHNAVMRPLYAKAAQISVAGRRLFDRENTIESFDKALRQGADAAVFTHVSNVFGYILPVEELAKLCTEYGVPFVIDAAQSAGCIPISLRGLGADFIAAPGHKGLLGPQGTGILLCGRNPEPLFYGGTGSASRDHTMPSYLPDRLEAGTLNVPGIAGLGAALRALRARGVETVGMRERAVCRSCAEMLVRRGMRVFRGKDQGGTVSFLSGRDPEQLAALLKTQGIAVRAGLHCAPLAHESAGTLATGTVRISFGHDAALWQVSRLEEALKIVDVM